MSSNGAEKDQVSEPTHDQNMDAIVINNSANDAQEKGIETKNLPEVDEFGLPVRKARRRQYDDDNEEDTAEGGESSGHASPKEESNQGTVKEEQNMPEVSNEASTQKDSTQAQSSEESAGSRRVQSEPYGTNTIANGSHDRVVLVTSTEASQEGQGPNKHDEAQNVAMASRSDAHPQGGASEWSHQTIEPKPGKENDDENDDDGWQDMPAFATHTIYDDWGKVLAREQAELDEEEAAYGHLGGAGKGYTKVQLDDDAESVTSMDDNTAYLFKSPGAHTSLEDDEESRDVLSQMQATKDLLNEGQRIAYVGLVRLSMVQMTDEIDNYEQTKGAKKYVDTALEAMKMWGQKMMLRLYSHMEIDAAEQIMIEQLATHGVQPADLTPTLMQNARVKNPAAEQPGSSRVSTSSPGLADNAVNKQLSTSNLSTPSTPVTPGAPPPYEEKQSSDYLTIKDPSQLPTTKSLDIDLRWTVLCDLFLVLIADSVYDSRSRTLVERVGSALDVPWLDICRFEKRVTDALEMQEAADKENWNEDEHMQERDKSARNRRLMMMGLATVGGGLVIGLSAGLLAPVIGAGLAAGFTTIGVAGTSGFLAGAGGAAMITTIGVTTGGTIAVRASKRRMGAVKTFEYRPLHNNKRVNLIVTVAGWMTGKVDDVRLPYSTVDPIMGDIYSIFWEPEMLQSMGQTINILATEALTQGLQQILGSTILTALMASLSLPLVLTKLSYLIDNPWAVSMARADLAGLILADSLIDRNLGVRPVTLVGFSLGARVIFACLKELANKGAFGLVQNVYLFGSPVVVKKDEYTRARTVVSGRFVNGYANNDWILGYLFRATSGGIMRVAGLATVDVPGVENHDVTALVPGHMAYRTAMPRLLREVGWVVESDEFTEIEDPDPENHEARQRELINEIEEARRKLDEKPEKKGFKALFSRKKRAEKKEWETYDERTKAEPTNGAAPGEEGASKTGEDGAVLFDIDAIRREAVELASQGVELKEIKGTLPPIKVNTGTSSQASTTSSRPGSIYGSLRQTQSYSGAGGGYNSRSPSYSNTSLPQGHKVPSSNPSYDYHEFDDHDSAHGESNISMTFEDDDRRPARSAGAQPPRTTTSHSPEPSPRWPEEQQAQQRPPLHTANTMPVAGSAALDHNAWADEEEDFGQEREMEMTFE